MTRLQRILLPKMSFFVRQKVHISSKILPQIPIFASFFSHPKMWPFQQRITVIAANLFNEVLRKQMNLACTFLKEKTSTAECPEQLLFFAWNRTVSLHIIF